MSPIRKKKQTLRSGIGSAFLLSALLLNGCALSPDGQTSPEGEPQQLGHIEQSVVNGNVGWLQGVVALYTGFVRPCSGTYLAGGNNTYWVLTALHCVTTDGELDSPLKPASSMSVTAQTFPGLSPPPMWYVTAVAHWQSIVQIEQFNTLADVALLKLAGKLKYYNHETGGTLDIGSYYPSASESGAFKFATLRCAGFGRERNLWLPPEFEDGSTGAGTARWADLYVTEANFSNLTVSRNGFQQALINGDSGGPCWWYHAYGKTLVGIALKANSTSYPTSARLLNVTGDSSVQDWIFDTMGL